MMHVEMGVIVINISSAARHVINWQQRGMNIVLCYGVLLAVWLVSAMRQ